MGTSANAYKRAKALEEVRAKLYSVAGGSIDSGDVKKSRLTLAQRIELIQIPEFLNYVDAERADGHEVFWPKDGDKCQAAGDVFTFAFKSRMDNQAFSSSQLRVLSEFLSKTKAKSGLKRVPHPKRTPQTVLDLFKDGLQGKPGLGLLDFWRVYWESQIGLTKTEKQALVTSFAPQYASKIYPGVAEENRLLEKAGVHVVLVTNGDQELAFAIAPYLGIKPENVVGSNLIYDANGVATGVNHSYEVFDEDWEKRPQPGKVLSFHYWLHMNRKRFGWDFLDQSKIVFAGRDGDSASADGGMMILFPQPPALGNFMVNTPGEPGRIMRFYSLAAKYGWTKGQFFTLNHSPSQSGAIPE